LNISMNFLAEAFPDADDHKILGMNLDHTVKCFEAGAQIK
jgi:hypothetical protein